MNFIFLRFLKYERNRSRAKLTYFHVFIFSCEHMFGHNKFLHTHWYWQDLAKEIAKWHLSIVEALQSSKLWKRENDPLLNRMEYCDEIVHAHWYWQDVAQGFVKCHLSLVVALPKSKFRKWLYLLNLLEYCDNSLRTHYYWQDLDTGIAKSHLTSFEAMPRSKFWKVEAISRSKFYKSITVLVQTQDIVCVI